MWLIEFRPSLAWSRLSIVGRAVKFGGSALGIPDFSKFLEPFRLGDAFDATVVQPFDERRMHAVIVSEKERGREISQPKATAKQSFVQFESASVQMCRQF